MNFEKAQTFPTYENEKETFLIEKNDAEKIKERRAFDFDQAVQLTLLGDLMEKNENESKANFSRGDVFTKYENGLVSEGKIPKINMLIDIDGVLIDTEAKIGEILEIFQKDFNALGNIKEAKKNINDTKIPFGSLRTLLKCKNKSEQITLITDRFGKGPCHFPCFNKKGKAVFEKHGIGVQTDTYKFSPLKSPESLAPIVSTILSNEITYYIGSSGSDRKYVKKLRDELRKIEARQDKLVYIHVEPENRRNIL